MMLNLNNMLFYTLYLYSIMLTISTNSIINCWMMMEINLITFIYIIHQTNNIINSETSMKYFLVNSISSMNFLFIFLYWNMNWNMNWNFFLMQLFYLMLNITLLMKLGMAPFHFWFPSVAEGMTWMNLLLLLIFQKIIPMIVIFYNMNYSFMLITMLFSSIVGSWGGLNQISLRKILTYSSINHMSWMTLNLMNNFQIWKLYFIIYAFHNCIIIFMLIFLNLNNIYQLYFIKKNNFMKIIFFLNFLSLGGLPPFVGFLMKWMTIKMMLNYMYIYLIILIMNSLISLFYYLQIMYSSMFLNYSFNMNNMFYMKNNLFILNVMMFMTITLNIVSFIFY